MVVRKILFREIKILFRKIRVTFMFLYIICRLVIKNCIIDGEIYRCGSLKGGNLGMVSHVLAYESVADL
jgi:hypothetical protein